jgi:hypothetical protein
MPEDDDSILIDSYKASIHDEIAALERENYILKAIILGLSAVLVVSVFF